MPKEWDCINGKLLLDYQRVYTHFSHWSCGAPVCHNRETLLWLVCATISYDRSRSNNIWDIRRHKDLGEIHKYLYYTLIWDKSIIKFNIKLLKVIVKNYGINTHDSTKEDISERRARSSRVRMLLIHFYIPQFVLPLVWMHGSLNSGINLSQ